MIAKKGISNDPLTMPKIGQTPFKAKSSYSDRT